MKTKENQNHKATPEAKTASSRRKFLTAGAATVAGAASALAFPQVSRAQTTTLKMQGSWGAADVWNQFAEDYTTRVKEMAGGRLKIDYLVSGAVVKAFQVQDAVHKGVLDAAHTVPVYWYGKSKVASLFGTGPQYGQSAHHQLAWIYYGGGQALYEELLKKLGLNIVGFFAFPMPTQPLGWFKKEIKSADDLVGLKYRTVGLAADLFQEMGVKVTQLPGGEIALEGRTGEPPGPRQPQARFARRVRARSYERCSARSACGADSYSGRHVQPLSVGPDDASKPPAAPEE